MTTMTAALYRQTGAARDVLEVTQVDRPEPGPGQVQVRIAVSAVNPTDVKNRAGLSARPIEAFQVPHMDGAGVIDAVGDGVDPARVGERVWVMLAAHHNRYGTAAEYAVVPNDNAVGLPQGVALDLAATLGVPAVTAANCLLADGPVAGLDVLVAGGAGGVGRCAVQLARWAGARVAATVSGPEKASVAASAGAHLVVNYRDPDVVERIRAWTDGVARVVEVSLAKNIALDLAAAAQDAVIVSYATDGGDVLVPARDSLFGSITYRYMLLYNLAATARANAVATVDAAVRDGALDLAPVQRFPLERIVEAHEAQESGPFGRILIDVADSGV
jgi:NADPH2:quinone reductase